MYCSVACVYIDLNQVKSIVTHIYDINCNFEKSTTQNDGKLVLKGFVLMLLSIDIQSYR